MRIKKGETDFDQSYYFPIETISIPDIKGNKANYIYSKTYTGNGKLYGYFNVPGYVSNPPDYVNDKSMQTFEIDVYNKTVKKMNLTELRVGHVVNVKQETIWCSGWLLLKEQVIIFTTIKKISMNL